MSQFPFFRVIARATKSPVAIRFLSFAVCLCLLLPLLSGCHGSDGRNAFVIPDSFDTTKNYEISFWAKNDTNITQVEI